MCFFMSILFQHPPFQKNNKTNKTKQTNKKTNQKPPLDHCIYLIEFKNNLVIDVYQNILKFSVKYIPHYLRDCRRKI